jgi:hypothetical protein
MSDHKKNIKLVSTALEKISEAVDSGQLVDLMNKLAFIHDNDKKFSKFDKLWIKGLWEIAKKKAEKLLICQNKNKTK